MNVCIPAETPDGARVLVTLTPAQAQSRIDQCRQQLQQIDVGRSRIEAEIRSLMLIANPETAYGDHYTMPGCATPGGAPNP